jgi:phosphoenolpyruvate carboxykinase (ATP)
MSKIDLSSLEIKVPELHHNLTPAALYEHAIQFDEGSQITSTGALTAMSGEKTGRCPKDKRIVLEPSTEKDVWWGDVNIPLE